MLHKYLKGRSWTQFGIDLIIGSRADKITDARDQTFLPDFLSSNLAESRQANGQPVLEAPRTILAFPDNEEDERQYFTPFNFFILLLILELYLLKNQQRYLNAIKKYDKIWLGVVTIAAVIILFMWIGTDHLACSDNYNLMVFSPLLLLLFLPKGSLNSGINRIVGVLLIISFVILPFVKMTVQNIHPAVLIIALITIFKLVRVCDLKYLRKYL